MRNEFGQHVLNGIPATRKELMYAAIRRISTQFRGEDGFKSPEHKLMFGIIEQAILDTCLAGVSEVDRQSALRYLQEDLYHAELCGVSSEWIRDTLTECDCFQPVDV